MDTEKTLLQYATEFRNAVEKACLDYSNKYTFFEKFPKQQCGVSTSLLGQYLLYRGIKTWYVCGRKESGPSHAWLATKDPKLTKDYILIDITIDQFGAEYPKVYVGKIIDFYNLYFYDFSHESHYLDEDDSFKDYEILYNIVCEYM